MLNENEKITKCPACGDTIAALSRVCESCGFVLDSGKKSDRPEKGLEDLIHDIEENLVKIKSQPTTNIITSLISNSHITFSLLTVIAFIIAIKFKIGVLLIVAVAMIIMSIVLIRKNLKSKAKDESEKLYAEQKALFEKHSRTATTLFGENKKTKLLLQELKQELDQIEQNRNKNKRMELVTYVVLALLTVSVFLIPSKMSSSEAEQENRLADKELVNQAEELISNNQLEEATLILKELSSNGSIVEIESKIQLAKLSNKLSDLEPLIQNKEYAKVSSELDLIVWEKVSTAYETEELELPIYGLFLKKKEAINNKLPAKYRVKIANKYLL